MSKLTREALVAELAARLKMPLREAGEILSEVTSVFSWGIQGGHTVPIPGIGTLAPRDQPERQVRNPKTGEVLTKPAGKTLSRKQRSIEMCCCCCLGNDI